MKPMLDFILHTEKEDAINLLKTDHENVKSLFNEFKDKERNRTKKQIVNQAINELRIHTIIEEEIFYPAVRKRIGDIALMNEANEEHHVAKLLIAELATMTGREEHYDAKFIVLSENVEHHVREEENDMFGKVRALEMDMVALGKRMLARKTELKKFGIPPTSEEMLIGAIGSKLLDSSARNAESKPKPRRRAAKASAKKTPAKKTKSASKAKPNAKKSLVAVSRVKQAGRNAARRMH